MKIALLGAAGFVGRAAAVELSRRPEVGEIILVDYIIRDAKKMAKALSPKCRYAMADVGKAPELVRLLEGIDAVVNAVGPCAEYEKPVLLACASMRTAAASIGDGTLPQEDRNEIHAAFRSSGTAAVSGCGMMPGWTDLLAAHFLGGGAAPDAPPPGLSRYLFFSPDRFGGYSFLRDFAKRTGGEAKAPPGAPSGRYFAMSDGTMVGVPGKKAGARLGPIVNTLGKLGPVGREFAAAMLLWLRGSMAGPPGTPAAVCGVSDGKRTARVEDPEGKITGILLAEAAVRLGSRSPRPNGLVPIHELIGREAARAIATDAGATITTG
ncbi:MAG: saccharopine dehydrogenase NADP-binding domain-containing protein [Deltaproteobacteria bacterium]|nr:saccharopine dehydrogenase NADP-binding domain-containing protein [Deltaproteobacteria bacterium]